MTILLRITINRIIILGYAAFMLYACQPKKETADLAAKLDEYLTGESKYFRFNGNVLIAEQGEIIFKRSFGYADFKTKRLLNDSSVFELASISKQFTATAILMLRDQGKLKLTDSLRHYFPELPYNNITIYQMLTHTSGLPDYIKIMLCGWDRSMIASNKDMIEIFARLKPPCSFQPGSKWDYSNTGYAILASIVEKASGMPFSEFVAVNIFQPLHMSHTRIHHRSSTNDTLANFAYGFDTCHNINNYNYADDSSDSMTVFYLDGIEGAVAVKSTTTDLLKWYRSIKNHTLLGNDSQEEMLEKKVLIDSVLKSYYGFGIYVAKTNLGNIIYHSGGWPGYYNFFGINTDKDQTVIVLSNNVSEARKLGMAMLEIVNGRPVEMPYEHKEIMIDSLELQRFVGRYKATSVFEIQRIGNKLFRITSDKPTVELKPESACKFFYADGTDRQLEFETDSNNIVVKAWLIGYGIKTELLKL